MTEHEKRTGSAALPEGQEARLPGSSRDASLHDQLYRYAEDLQQMIVRQQALESECETLRDACTRLSESRDTIESLIVRSADLHIVTDVDGHVLHCNPACAGLADPRHLVGTSLRSWVKQSHRANFDRLRQHALTRPEGSDEWELHLQREGATRSPMLVSAHALAVQREGEVRTLYWVLRDVTRLREIQFESQISSMVFRTTSEGVMITDVEGEILAVNPAFCQITGYSPEDVVGRTPGILRSGMHDAMFYADFWRRLRDEGSWKGEIYNRRKNGEIYPEWLAVNAARDEKGNILSYISVFSDLSRILQTERRLAYLAHHDMLTGLPNRLLFQDRLGQVLAQARRTTTPFTLIFIDLDRFKQINDSLGHEIGDIVLKEAAARLSGAVREVDTVARLGGDEFVIIAPELGTPEAVAVVCRKVIAALGETIDIDGHELFIGGSLGCAIWPQHGDDENALLKNADHAMYQAKAAGGNNFVLHSPQDEVAPVLINIEMELRRALAARQLRLVYQPQVTAGRRAVCGVEALLRWDHPTLGCVGPDEFIPLAERTGLIIEIGSWVLDEACAQLASWDAQGVPVYSMAVNLSPRQIRDPELLDTVRSVLERHRIDPARLELEVTESEAMHHMTADHGRLRSLHGLGVKIAIDDFGTGYSSLARLMHLPVDRLKIDRSFVCELESEGNARASAITDAILRMGEALGVEMVAEGVETDAQYQMMTRQGCHVIQGYFTGRPMPPDTLATWIRQQHEPELAVTAGD